APAGGLVWNHEWFPRSDASCWHSLIGELAPAASRRWHCEPRARSLMTVVSSNCHGRVISAFLSPRTISFYAEIRRRPRGGGAAPYVLSVCATACVDQPRATAERKPSANTVPVVHVFG